MCVQRRFSSACQTELSDQRLRYPFIPWLSKIHQVEIQIRLHGCADLSVFAGRKWPKIHFLTLWVKKKLAQCHTWKQKIWHACVSLPSGHIFHRSGNSSKFKLCIREKRRTRSAQSGLDLRYSHMILCRFVYTDIRYTLLTMVLLFCLQKFIYLITIKWFIMQNFSSELFVRHRILSGVAAYKTDRIV